MTDTLMVGVSGVRGIVGKDLTPEVVTRWARAFGTFARAGTRDGKRGQMLAVEGGELSGKGKRETGKVTADLGAVERHLDGVLELAALDVERIRKRRFSVALDAVRGAGGPPMRDLLERLGCRVTGINLEKIGRASCR